MVINLEVDETLLSDYHCYQQPPPQPQLQRAATAASSTPHTSCTFPKQIKMFPWNDIQQITQHIYEQTQIPIERQRLFFRGREITAYHSNKAKKKDAADSNNNSKAWSRSSPTLSFFGIGHESSIYLQCRAADDERPIVPYGFCSALLSSLSCSDGNKQLIQACVDGLFDDMRPHLANDGEGGTYFMRDQHNHKVACFKPSDEEAGCLNNPRGRTDAQQAIHSGIKPSQGHLREIAASLIDHGEHFHGVPPTIRVEIAYPGFHYNQQHHHHHHEHHHNNTRATPTTTTLTTASATSISPSGTTTSTHMQSMYHPPHKKVGALQKFIAGEVIENFGVKNFTQREVHKIGILDIRILNCDRNTGNVLVSRDEFGRYALQPIDHGLSLPEKIEITRDSWVWLHWEQSKQPFDPYTLNFIKSIDVERDIAQLRSELNFAEIVFENMRIAHLVLCKGAAKGLTLHEIGSIIARPDFDTKSILEELMTQAEILAIEKWRQRRHLSNRIRHKRRTHSLKTPQVYPVAAVEGETASLNMPRQPHSASGGGGGKYAIVQKFIEKGKTLKVPLIGNPPPPPPPHYLTSLAPPNAIPRQRQIQVVNRNVNVALASSAGSLHGDSHHHHPGGGGGEQTHSYQSLSPNPMSLYHSTSLGSGAMSSGTPEPLTLYHSSSSNGDGGGATDTTPQQQRVQKPKPATVIVHRANSTLNASKNKNKNKRSPQFDIFFTPNFRSQSQSSSISTTRSVTPDRTLQMHDSPRLMPPALYLEHNDHDHDDDLQWQQYAYEHESPLPIKSRMSVEQTEMNMTPRSRAKAAAARKRVQRGNTMTPKSAQDKEEEEEQEDEHTICSPVQVHALALEKTSSIHGREHETDLRQRRSSTTMNTMAILQSISVASRNSDQFPDRQEAASTVVDTIKLRASSDEDEAVSEDETLSKVDLNALCLTNGNGMKKSNHKSHPFSFLSVDTSFAPSKQRGPSTWDVATIGGGGGGGDSCCVATAEMVPLERSTSCLDVRKSSSMSLKSVPLTLDSRSTKNLMANTGPQVSNPLLQQSHDEDFLYSKSASLINHPSMLDTRKQMTTPQQQLQMVLDEDSNHSHSHSQSNIDVIGSKSLSEISATAMAAAAPNLMLEHTQLRPLKLSDSPANSTQNHSHSNLLNSPSTASHDDLITTTTERDDKCEFLIHPIMERMAKENEFVRQWFMHYLDRLLEIQCRRIRNRQCNKNDKLDDVYDVDTVKGSFVWKNELRKHWIRSRVELKKILNEKKAPPTNPFDHQHSDEHTHTVRTHSSDRHSVHEVEHTQKDDENEHKDDDGQDEDEDDDDEEEEEETEEEEQWFAGDRLEDHDLDEEEEEEENDWFARDEDVDSDGEEEEEEDVE